MPYFNQGQCRVCGRVFCCTVHRNSHEEESHTKYVETLKKLPLTCKACLRILYSIYDLKTPCIRFNTHLIVINKPADVTTTTITSNIVDSRKVSNRKRSITAASSPSSLWHTNQESGSNSIFADKSRRIITPACKKKNADNSPVNKIKATSHGSSILDTKYEYKLTEILAETTTSNFLPNVSPLLSNASSKTSELKGILKSSTPNEEESNKNFSKFNIIVPTVVNGNLYNSNSYCASSSSYSSVLYTTSYTTPPERPSATIIAKEVTTAVAVTTVTPTIIAQKITTTTVSSLVTTPYDANTTRRRSTPLKGIITNFSINSASKERTPNVSINRVRKVTFDMSLSEFATDNISPQSVYSSPLETMEEKDEEEYLSINNGTCCSSANDTGSVYYSPRTRGSLLSNVSKTFQAVLLGIPSLIKNRFDWTHDRARGQESCKVLQPYDKNAVENTENNSASLKHRRSIVRINKSCNTTTLYSYTNTPIIDYNNTQTSSGLENGFSHPSTSRKSFYRYGRKKKRE